MWWIYIIVENALEQKQKLNDEDKTEILSKIEIQHENLRKILSYTDFLFESV